MLNQPLDEVRGDALLDVDPLGRRTHLSGIEEPSPGGAGDGGVEVGVGEDDERIDAAELEVDLLEAGAGARRDGAPHRYRTGEGDEIHAGVLDERAAGLRSTGDDVDDAGRQPVVALRHQEIAERVLMRRLADDGVPCHERRRHLPRHQQQAES